MKKIVIAIDGPAGSGKSTAAKLIAKKLKIPYIDTGAMYRAVTLKVMKSQISLDDKKALVRAAKKARIAFKGFNPMKQRVYLDGRDVTREIRLPELTKKVFHLAQLTPVRKELVRKQKRLGKFNGAVMEGRDIGTIVFPKADFKFYFEAKPTERAKRRYKELCQAGHKASLKSVLRDILKRDATDYNRKEGPLKKAKDAHLIDTTSLTIDETVDKICALVMPNVLKGQRLGQRSG
jgi:cytidylate kinase